MLGHAHVSLQDEAVAAAGRERVSRPAERAHARLVAAHRARGLALGRVPDLYLAYTRAHLARARVRFTKVRVRVRVKVWVRVRVS